MAEAILEAMGSVLTRWTMGAAAAPAAPVWRVELGADPAEAELRLLALSGQFLAVAVTVEAPVELRALPDIPALGLPTVPDPLRPLVRRLLAAGKKHELLHFIALRGWTVHPGDWMPGSNAEGVPDAYASWCDWAEFAASTVKVQRKTADQITPENWDDWWPAARKVALAELRRRDPAAARLLLEAKLGGENAEVRLGLLAFLNSGLSEEDVPFLESIAANDRAPKVKALADSLLSRMSRGPAVKPQFITDIQEYFLVEVKGLLRRSRVIKLAKLKVSALSDWRLKLLGHVDVATFSGALKLSGSELLKAWDWQSSSELNAGLMEMVARSGTDALAVEALEGVTAHLVDAHLVSGNLHGLVHLASRLDPARKTKLENFVLHAPGVGFEGVKRIAGGLARLEDPLASPSGAALLAALARADTKLSDQADELQALGLITARPWARRVMERLNAAGIVQGDPRLDMLRLKEALEDKGEKV